MAIDSKITAAELRIGNWVIDEDGDFMEVLSIEENYVWHEHGIFSHVETIRGVELTPELLTEIGFVQPKNDESILWVHGEDLQSYLHDLRGTFRFAFLEGDNKLTVSLGDNSHGCLFARLAYLHELQNLWYVCNNKEELKIDLTSHI